VSVSVSVSVSVEVCVESEFEGTFEGHSLSRVQAFTDTGFQATQYSVLKSTRVSSSRQIKQSL
jgi:hypothetical protein